MMSGSWIDMGGWEDGRMGGWEDGYERADFGF
jgi:hypothetical protein